MWDFRRPFENRKTSAFAKWFSWTGRSISRAFTNNIHRRWTMNHDTMIVDVIGSWLDATMIQRDATPHACKNTSRFPAPLHFINQDLEQIEKKENLADEGWTVSWFVRPDRNVLKAPGHGRKYFNPRSGDFCLSTSRPLSCRDKYHVWCNSRCLLNQRLMTLIRVNKVSL